MKYEHLPIEVRELVRLSDLAEYMDGKIDTVQLKAREDGTDRWQASGLLMGGMVTVGQFQQIEPSYKTDYVAAFLALAGKSRNTS